MTLISTIVILIDSENKNKNKIFPRSNLFLWARGLTLSLSPILKKKKRFDSFD